MLAEITRFGHSLRAVPDDAVAAAIETLSPRFVLTFGIAPIAGLPDDCPQFRVDRPDDAQSGRSPSCAAFFALDLHATHVVSATMRPWYFDLAVISADYRLGDRRRIIAGLRSTAHRRSVAIVLRRPTNSPGGSLADARDGIAAAFTALDYAGLRARSPALLVGGLDRATARSPLEIDEAAGSAPGDAASFLDRHRIERTPFSTEPAPIADAPGHPGGTIRPRYVSIADGETLVSYPASGNPRAIGRWWGRKLALIEAGLWSAQDVGFVAADGMNRALLIDRTGKPLGISYRYERGFGERPGEAIAQLAPACVHAADGSRYPLQAAPTLLSGKRIPGCFFLLGWVDPRFGHFLVESLAGLWAADWALARDMRFLFWGRLKPYHRMALKMLGIPDDRLVVAEPGAVYERLVFADPGFRMMGSVSPVVARAWTRIAEAAIADGGDERAPEPFLYLSRRGEKNRPLENEAELESLLAERGGRILRPETLRFDQQVHAVRCARALVGCFGSQLHLSMFQRPGARKLVIGSTQFLGPDEALIAIANGTVADHYVEPAAKRQRAAARSDPWSIDLDRFMSAFDRWLADGDAPRRPDTA